jgi:hypothetical protein
VQKLELEPEPSQKIDRIRNTAVAFIVLELGMHWISGLFLYPVSGRILDCHVGYPVRPDTGYPANVWLIQ